MCTGATSTMLLLDLPPGTGDVAISVAQLFAGAGDRGSHHPQHAAAEVAERAGAIALQTRQRIVGVVENMSGLLMPDGSTMQIFGEGGGRRVADSLSRGGRCGCPSAGSGSTGSCAGDRRGLRGATGVVGARLAGRPGSCVRSPTSSPRAGAAWPGCRWDWTRRAAEKPGYVASVSNGAGPPVGPLPTKAASHSWA